MKKFIFGLCIILLGAFSLTAYAGTPLDTIKGYINKVLAIVSDKSLTRDAKVKKIEVLYEQMFDEEELSRRSLGRNWKKLTPAQRKEFIPLFRQVLEKAYIDRILAYNNEKIVFSKQVMNSDTLAEVRSTVITSSREVPIVYRVILKGGTWKAYDVVIENVSLIQNYRTQFNEILSRNSPEQLLEILRERVKKK
jgi:phospholipid transport system substrate-binding protein